MACLMDGAKPLGIVDWTRGTATFISKFKLFHSRKCIQENAMLPLHLSRPDDAYMRQGVVSLTFRELPKIFSRKYPTPEITFMVRISIWKFVRVPRLWAHVQSFSFKFSSQVLFVQHTNFERIFWRARETLVKQPPGNWAIFGSDNNGLSPVQEKPLP